MNFFHPSLHATTPSGLPIPLGPSYEQAYVPTLPFEPPGPLQPAPRSIQSNSTVNVLGHDLPAELVNKILELVAEDEKEALISATPRLVTAVLDHQSANSAAIVDEYNVVMPSSSSVFQVHRALRAWYYSIYKAKVLEMEMNSVTVIVEDFDFSFFNNDFGYAVSEEAMLKLQWSHFRLRLRFTDEFLLNPDPRAIRDWFNSQGYYADPATHLMTTRNWLFDYSIDPIPKMYVSRFILFYNSCLAIPSHREPAGPGHEVQKFLDDVGSKIRSGGLVKAGTENQAELMEVDDAEPNHLFFFPGAMNQETIPSTMRTLKEYARANRVVKRKSGRLAGRNRR